MALQSTTALATVTLQQSTSTVTFSGIPNTYRDLIIVFVATGSGDENLTPIFNGSSSDFSWVQMTTGPAGNSGTNNSIGRIAGSNQTFGMMEIFDYAQTNKQKTFLVTTNVTGSERRQLAARWAQTTAINSISLAIRTGYIWSSGSTFALFGRIA